MRCTSDLLGAVQEARIVPGQHAARAVTEAIHFLRTGHSQHRVDDRGELAGGIGHRRCDVMYAMLKHDTFYEEKPAPAA